MWDFCHSTVLSDDPEWKLHCVVGSRGIGKTALVKKVYDDDAVKKHFNHTLWLEIPRVSDVKELMKNMITINNDHSRRVIEAMDTNMLAQFIRQLIESSRYFIVLDDVPDIGIWRALKCTFPIENCGSRIIIISRSPELCHNICVETRGDSHVYSLNLSEEESWILFCRKVFSGSLVRPLPLMQISKDIVEKCNGFPLAILVIACALATKGKNTEAWELFHGSLVAKLQGSYSEVEHMKRILDLCYQDLPFYLKSCFIYLSIIPKDHVIDKMRLIRLWAAEGLVVEREGKAIAQVAESYLNELANRSLIQVARKHPDGRCLNLRSTKIKHIPGSIGKLENLEFLDLRETLVNKLPVEILKLQELRHIFSNHFAAGYIHGFEAPNKIGTLVSLEMVNRINATTSTLIELGKLTRLRMLYIAKLRRKHGRDLCSSLDKLINLQQLTISSFGVGDIIDLHYPLHSTHSSLRTLVFEGRLERFPQWVTSLQVLAIVVLRGSKLMDNALETLQDLPNLVKLVLDRAFEGEELRFGAGRFKKLKILCILHSTKLRQMKVEEGAMPFLEELQLCNCGLMEDLPFGIEHLRKLGYLLLEEISEKLLMTLQLKDSQSGDYWKIAHITRVHVKML
uniref:Disease resistance protein RPM1-like n=1 Tax=Nicotiana tabacum TaxID=4097 RepID=A0A1S4AWG7_TOBAC|nr:PREDICTED: disease resistance protein RPM1-like [Nicotiana tabacum]